MQLIDLFEARRAEARAEMERRMAPFRGQPDLYVSMRSVNKLGINPHSRHYSTPLGIYAYQLTDEIYEQIIEDKLPFMGYQKYISVFRGDTKGQIRSGDRATIEAATAQLPEPSEEVMAEMFAEYSTLNPHNSFSPSLLTPLLHKSAALAYQELGGKNGHFTTEMATRWNTILRRIGVQSIRDDGSGGLFNIEPTQTVFLSTKPITPVAVVRNKTMHYHREIQNFKQWKYWTQEVSTRDLAGWLEITILEGSIPMFPSVKDRMDKGRFPSEISPNIRFERSYVMGLIRSFDLHDKVDPDLIDWIGGERNAFYDTNNRDY